MPADSVTNLITRCRDELAAAFDFSRPVQVNAAPAVLDVMGGSTEYTGGTVYSVPLNCSAAVALQDRDDQQVQVFSFNLFDAHQPFTFIMPLRALASAGAGVLREGFKDPSRRWAGYLAGCLHVLHVDGAIDLKTTPGANLALLSTISPTAGVGSSTAITVATMKCLFEHFQLAADAMRVAKLCQTVERDVLGICGGIAQPLASYRSESNLPLPPGTRIVGIDSGVWRDADGSRFQTTRTAAAIAHALILVKMHAIGQAAGMTLVSDPTHGQLARLDADDYKRHFRPYLPEAIRGDEFLAAHGSLAEPIDLQTVYPVQKAADHHVLEARRIRRFIGFLQEAATHPAGSTPRKCALDKAGHLMYASHIAYTNDALLGADECDLLVKLIRDREYDGLYGAKITGRGSGGTVAVLCEEGERADAAMQAVRSEYERQTARKSWIFRSL